jgi:Flp pilus assembly protein TadB
MLTKQSRQFEQWAQDNEKLMAIKAKRAAEQQAKTKKNSASLLMKLGVTVVAIACYGFLYNQDTDWAVVLVFGFAVTVYGVVNLDK